MDEADREQHDHAGIMRPPRLFTAALDQDQAPCAEQHGEQRAELVLDEDEASQPDAVIGIAGRAVTQRVVIGRAGQREGVDVHPHDPDHRNPAQRVERKDAGGGG